MFGRFLAVLWVLGLLGISGVEAAGAQESAMAASTVELTGVWRGTFDASPIQGDMQLTLAAREAQWVGEVKLNVEGQELADSVRGIEVSNRVVTFQATVDGAAVFFEGELTARGLLGAFTALQGDEVVAAGSWQLNRSTGSTVKP